MYKLGKKEEDNKTIEIKMLISTREEESNGDSSFGYIEKGGKTTLRDDSSCEVQVDLVICER